jgi:hypothetical protein
MSAAQPAAYSVKRRVMARRYPRIAGRSWTNALLHRDRDFDPFEEWLDLSVIHP